MKIAELFTEVVLKGSEDVSKGLAKINTAFKSAGESALLTKAAIGAVVFGLERLTGFASQAGMDLTKFAATTGLSTDALQRWQVVGRMYDVSGQEMQQTIENLQQMTADMMMGKGMPEGAAALGIKMTRDPMNLMEQLRQKAKELPPDIGYSLMKSFNLSPNMYQFFRSSNEDLSKVKKAFILSSGEIDQLTKVNKAWKDLWLQLEMFGKHTVAANGLWAVSELGKAFKWVTTTASNIKKLTEEFKGLKTVAIALGVGLALYFAPITTLVGGLVMLLGELQKKREGKDNLIDYITGDSKKGTLKEDIRDNLPKLPSDKELAGGFKSWLSNVWHGFTHPMELNPMDSLAQPIPQPMTAEQAFAQAARSQSPGGAGGIAGMAGPTSGMTVNIDVHNHGITDFKGVESASERGVRKGISSAHRQLSAATEE